jgi:hypothetical protein
LSWSFFCRGKAIEDDHDEEDEDQDEHDNEHD